VNNLVSVVIPTFNREELITRAIYSVLNQKYKEWELIIVDDRSTDNTERVINDRYSDHSRIKFFKRPETRIKGANACRNIGAEKGSGEYIAFLDSDDEWLPNHLENKINKLKTTKAKFVFGSFFVNKADSIRKIKCVTNAENEKVDTYLSSSGDLRTSTFVIEKKAFLEIKFDEELNKHQDWDFALRFCNKFDFAVDESFTVKLFYEEKRMSNNLNHKATYQFLDRHKLELNNMALENILTMLGWKTYRLEGHSENFKKYVQILRNDVKVTNKMSFIIGYIIPLPLVGFVTGKLLEIYKNLR